MDDKSHYVMPVPRPKPAGQPATRPANQGASPNARPPSAAWKCGASRLRSLGEQLQERNRKIREVKPAPPIAVSDWTAHTGKGGLHAEAERKRRRAGARRLAEIPVCAGARRNEADRRLQVYRVGELYANGFEVASIVRLNPLTMIWCRRFE